MKTKDDRLAAITAIISSQVVSNQDELLEKLNLKGFNVTQATLSRDIKELKIVKVHTANGYKYQIHSEKHLNTARSNGILSVDSASNFIVIKTGPGFAGAVASTIDTDASCNAIMGTIAGDDTVLVILRSADSLAEAMDAISGAIPNIKSKTI